MNILAQKLTNPVVGNKLQDFESGASDEFLITYVPMGVSLLFVAGSVFFFVQLVWGGISYISSGGEKGSLESARARLTHAIIGFVLLISTFALVELIEAFFGINILSIDIDPLFIR